MYSDNSIRICILRMTVKTWPIDPLGLRNIQLQLESSLKSYHRDITGLWQPSVHSDVAF